MSFCTLFGEVPSLNSVGYSLKSINLSDNRFNSLQSPDLRYLPNLVYFNIENNELKNIPLEFGVCNHLKALLIQGNPTKIVSYAIIQKGTTSVVNFMKSKIPLDSVLLQPLKLNITAPILPNKKEIESVVLTPILQNYSIYNKVPLGRNSQSKNIERNNIYDLDTNVIKSQPSTTSVSKSEISKSTFSEFSPSETIKSLQEIDKNIEELEKKLEMGVAPSKQFALKREINMLRSQRIKILN